MRSSLSASVKYATDESEVIWVEAIIVTKAYSGRRKVETGLTYLSVFMSIPRSQDTFCSLNAELLGQRLLKEKFITHYKINKSWQCDDDTWCE